jgi:hypothetical protein
MEERARDEEEKGARGRCEAKVLGAGWEEVWLYTSGGVVVVGGRRDRQAAPLTSAGATRNSLDDDGDDVQMDC